MLKLLSVVFFSLLSVALNTHAATGGQYGNYTYPYNPYYSRIPLVTVAPNGYSCTVVDPRYGNVATTGTGAQCTGFGSPNLWTAAPQADGAGGFTAPPAGILSRNEWYAYYYNRRSPYSSSTGGMGYNSYYYGTRYTNPYAQSFDNPYTNADLGTNNVNFVGDVGGIWISGGDFNGDGVVDCMVYDGTTGQLGISDFYYSDQGSGWYFGDEQTFNIGSGNSSGIFFMNYDGRNDWISLGHSDGKNRVRIKLINPVTRETKTIRMSGVSFTSKSRPVPVALAHGGDLFAFYRRVGSFTSLVLKDKKGRTVRTAKLPGTGEVIVGDYTEQPGEEIAVRNRTGFTILNPNSPNLTKINAPSTGTAVDAINYTRIIK